MTQGKPPNKAVSQYLARHAEPEASHSGIVPGEYDNVLVVPACRESASALMASWRNLNDQSVLIVLVVNNPPGEQRGTAPLIDAFGSSFPRRANLMLSAAPGRPDCLVIDRSSVGFEIPARQGVGLARKIGADVALSLITRGSVASPWIHSTDADAKLPAGYLAAVPATDAAAMLYPFEHHPRPGHWAGCYLYEIMLHYYVAGLAWAGSPYAFHTVGSTLAVDGTHYARVRGFPKRNAAEDFYLLNKLAKSGPIVSLESPVIQLDGRLSDRVPVGTGPGIRRASEAVAADRDPPFYDPQCFSALRVLLAGLEVLAQGGDPTPAWGRSEHGSAIAEFLGDTDLLAGLPASGRNRQRYLFERLDGFRTLKFIHFIRDHCAPDTNLDAARSAPFFPADGRQDMPLGAGYPLARLKPIRDAFLKASRKRRINGVAADASAAPSRHR